MHFIFGRAQARLQVSVGHSKKNHTRKLQKHKKEIWKWKQKEADWIKTNNLLQGSKKIIEELSAKLVEQIRIISELEYNNKTYKKEIEKLLAEKNK